MAAPEFILAGRYRLIAPLGEGGMATVYRGRDLRLNRDVAVKILREDLTRDPSFLDRFRREAEIVAGLSHPNTVPVYDVGEDQEAHFIVMEYVRGRTLKEAIDASGQLPVDQAVAIIERVLDALDCAHRQGLVHRDVKPANILLTPDGTPRLVDFGIAHLVDASTTRTAAILGSAHYLSPEQSRGEEATFASDIYACGVVLYEMLTGRPPFDGPNPLAIAHQHLHTDPPALREGGVSPGLDAAVARALSKDPQRRFPDTSSFLAALHDAPTSYGSTSVQPLPGHDETSAQPLAGQTTTEMPLHPEARPLPRTSSTGITVRRSGRKSYLVSAMAALGLLVAAYLSSLPPVSHEVPSYPSALYALLPAAIALVILASWLSARSWVYTLDGNAAVMQWGLLGHHRFGVPLRTVVSLELRQSPLERLLGVGTIELRARDQHGEIRRLVMEDLSDPRQRYDELLEFLGRASRGNRPG
jgi:serine/threonine protein kinase